MAGGRLFQTRGPATANALSPSDVVVRGICMDQSLTGFYRVGQKLSDVIPVLRIKPRATEPHTVSVFLSSVKCGRICRAQTCAHSGTEPSTLAKGFQSMDQKFEKNSNFGPFLVCFFVCSVNDFSATRGPIHAIFCMRA